jgi:bacillithiol system protein YtxJ
MNWKELQEFSQLEEIKKLSKDKPVLIFKHSTRCSISSMAWDRMRRNWKESDFEKITPYFLDLISFREVSNEVASKFGVRHESPQVLLIKDAEVVYHNSHMGISYQDILKEI